MRQNICYNISASEYRNGIDNNMSIETYDLINRVAHNEQPIFVRL